MVQGTTVYAYNEVLVMVGRYGVVNFTWLLISAKTPVCALEGVNVELENPMKVLLKLVTARS